MFLTRPPAPAPLALSLLLLASPILVAGAAAQDASPQALDGLRSITVLVERAAPEVVAAGIDTAAVRHQAEDAVQRLGLTLVPPASQDSAGGVLYVNTFVATNPERSWYAAYVELEVLQPVTIDRTPDARLHATTWQAPVRLRVVEPARVAGEITQVLSGMLEEFGSAWRSANPGGAAAGPGR
ncbi:MAG TPA: hypothetical protein VK012_05550 [Gemmatimonadales bacterium]|nr:hypothetical protein [Gemmatimonadales bacterium]